MAKHQWLRSCVRTFVLCPSTTLRSLNDSFRFVYEPTCNELSTDFSETRRSSCTSAAFAGNTRTKELLCRLALWKAITIEQLRFPQSLKNSTSAKNSRFVF